MPLLIAALGLVASLSALAGCGGADAKRGETVEVEDGGFLKVGRYYDADITSDKQSVVHCNR